MKLPRATDMVSAQLPKLQAPTIPQPRLISVRNQKFVPQAHTDLMYAIGEQETQILANAGALIGQGIDTFAEARKTSQVESMKTAYLKNTAELKHQITSKTPFSETDASGNVTYPWENSLSNYKDTTMRMYDRITGDKMGGAVKEFDLWRTEIDIRNQQAIAKWQAEKEIDRHYVEYVDTISNRDSIEQIDEDKSKQLQMGVLAPTKVITEANKASSNLVERQLHEQVDILSTQVPGSDKAVEAGNMIRAINGRALQNEWWSIDDYNKVTRAVDNVEGEWEGRQEAYQDSNRKHLNSIVVLLKDDPKRLYEILEAEILKDTETAIDKYGLDGYEFYYKAAMDANRPTVLTDYGVARSSEILLDLAKGRTSAEAAQLDLINLAQSNQIGGSYALSAFSDALTASRHRVQNFTDLIMDSTARKLTLKIQYDEVMGRWRPMGSEQDRRKVDRFTAMQVDINTAVIKFIEGKNPEDITGDHVVDLGIEIAKQHGLLSLGHYHEFNVLYDKTGQRVSNLEDADYKRTEAELAKVAARYDVTKQMGQDVVSLRISKLNGEGKLILMPPTRKNVEDYLSWLYGELGGLETIAE